MTGRARSFIRQNIALFGVLALASAVVLWFASRLVLDALYFSDPRHVDVDLRPWMTPRYIVLTYDLPRPFVRDLLALDGKVNRRVRLGHLAAERGITMEALTAEVRAAAAQYREARE